jgi:hypothetical protein
MTPPELRAVEDTLRRAYADALAEVERHETGHEVPIYSRLGRPSRGIGRPGQMRRWVVATGAGAAVAVISLVAGLVIPNALQPRASLSAVPQHMAYVAATGEVIPVSLSTDTALWPIMLGVPGATVGAVMAPGGRTVYVATYRGYVVPVDTVTRTAGPAIRVGGIPQAMVVSPDGRTGYLIEPPYGVAVVDFARRQLAGFVKVRGAWNFALTPNGKTLYVVSWSGTVTPVDTTSLTTLRPISTPGYPGDPDPAGRPYGPNGPTVPSIAVTPDGRTAYVVGVKAGASDVLTPISTATNRALAPIRLPDGRWDASMSFSPDGRTGYLTGTEVTAINLTAGAVSWTAKLPVIWLPMSQITMSPDGSTLYALAFDLQTRTESIYRIPAATGIPQQAPIQLGRVTPPDQELDLSPDGRTLYIQNWPARGKATMDAFDAATGRPGRLIRIGWPGPVVFGPS